VRPRNFVRFVLLAGVLGAAALSIGCSAPGATGQTPASTSAGSSAGTAGSSSTQATQQNGEGQLHTATYKLNGAETAVIKTDKGTIKVKFYEKDAPNTVASFIELAKSGFYDKTAFHRVIPGFVAQGGDPQSKGMSPDQVAQAAQAGQLGTGGPGYNLKAEFNSQKHLEGTVAMARSQSPDSAGSQFYICLAPQPSLDGQYTVFGQVTEGMDVVKKLGVGSIVESITIENASK
jgi:peptidyl-prolyl cis-trans isomerase B (cyclophilin B)